MRPSDHRPYHLLHPGRSRLPFPDPAPRARLPSAAPLPNDLAPTELMEESALCATGAAAVTSTVCAVVPKLQAYVLANGIWLPGP